MQERSVILEVQNISKLHGSIKTLDQVSFSINRGEIFGLLGPNGAGKSTLLSILAGAAKPSSGKALLNHTAIEPSNLKTRTLIGLVPQEYAFYEELSARENLLFFGQLFGVPTDSLKNKINEILQIIGLDDQKSSLFVKFFSGGMKRRLNLGIALVHSPEILMLDEPTVGVDPQSRNRIFEAIKNINQMGTTVIYTTHYMEEAESLCNRIAILDEGKIIACDTLQNLLALTSTTINFTISEITEQKFQTLQKKLPNLKTSSSPGSYSITSYKDSAPDIINLLVNEKIEIVNLYVNSPDLEKVFLSLTGKHLRD